MRTFTFLGMLWYCLIFPALAQGQILEQKVSLKYTAITLEEALKDISKKYHVNFSYSSNVIPLKKRVTLTVVNKPLSVALKELFKGTDVTYEAVGSQVVLKKTKKASAGEKGSIEKKDTMQLARESNVDTAAAVIEEGTDQLSTSNAPAQVYMPKDTVQYFPEENFKELSLNDTLDKASLRKKYLTEKKRLRDQYQKKMDSLDRTGNQTSKENLKDQFNRVSKKLKTKIEALRDSLSTLPIKLRDTTDTGKQEQPHDAGEDTSGYAHKPAQVTFVPPIGTNGTDAGNCVNNLSFNVLAGNAAGLEGFELAGLVNVEKDYVYGFQVAGLGNVVRKKTTGGQVSGLFNINDGYTQAIQVSGFMNLVSDSLMGLQFAGFTNIVKEEVEGGQVAGFLNVAHGNMVGGQVAGFLNSADTINGAQVSGFLNVAKRVKGVQVGCINVADTVVGAQLGVISFGGYRKLEIFGGETLYGNIAFKTGSRHLHNIFAVGVQPSDSAFNVGLGYGLGSEVRISRRTILNLDALAYSIHHEKFTYKELNLLNQFRATFGFMLTRNTSIFAGPVFNVMVSKHYMKSTGEYGSPIVPKWNLYSHTENNVNTTLWIGFNAGIRF